MHSGPLAQRQEDFNRQMASLVEVIAPQMVKIPPAYRPKVGIYLTCLSPKSAKCPDIT